MLREEAIVASVSENGWAQVITDKRDACGSCRASHCCSSFGPSSKMVIRALNRAGARAGDVVSISLKTQTMIRSVAIVYLIPVLTLLMGAFVGASLSPRLGANETTTSMLLAFLGLGLGFMINITISKWMAAKKGLTPVVTGILRTGVRTPESFMAIDPVCKMKVDPAKVSASVVYKDKTYYFCRPSCKDAFLKGPESYL